MARKENTLPKSLSEYKVWLRQKRKFDLRYLEREYDFVQAAFERALRDAEVWKMFQSNLDDYGHAYNVKTGFELLHRSEDAFPRIDRKSHESFLEKTYRYTFLKAGAPPSSEKDIPDPFRYYGVIDDILRSVLVVKFLDGVEFVIRKLDALCNACGASKTVEYKNNDKGYFAAHYYLRVPVATTLPNGTPFDQTMTFELQITTQLQEVLRRLLHFEYERERLAARAASDVPWQWKYREHEFFSNYLGHMIRNIEGQIMDVRRRRDIADANAE